VTGRGRELKTLVEEPGEKNRIERVRRIWEDNIEVGLIKIWRFEVKVIRRKVRLMHLI
jgi:hypothetical protein